MSTDLNRALSDLADQAADTTPGLPVDALLFQRRRRRTVHRSFATGGVAAGLTAVAVIAGQLTGTPEPVQPATPTPTPTVSPSPTVTPVAMPVCGGRVDGVPVELTLDAAPEQTLGTPLTGTITGAAGDAQLMLLIDGVVVAMGDSGADQAPDSCGGELAARDYQVVAVLDGEAGAVRSEAVPVALVEPEAVDPTADWEPLPDPFGPSPFDGNRYTSDTPGPTQPLADGRYFVYMNNLDPATRSFDATITVALWGDDAYAHVETHPEYQVPSGDNGEWDMGGLSLIQLDTEFGTQRMTIPDHATVVGFCLGSTGSVRTLEELLVGDPACEVSSQVNLPIGPNEFWMDIRDGEIQQLVGQFVS